MIDPDDFDKRAKHATPPPMPVIKVAAPPVVSRSRPATQQAETQRRAAAAIIGVLGAVVVVAWAVQLPLFNGQAVDTPTVIDSTPPGPAPTPPTVVTPQPVRPAVPRDVPAEVPGTSEGPGIIAGQQEGSEPLANRRVCSSDSVCVFNMPAGVLGAQMPRGSALTVPPEPSVSGWYRVIFVTGQTGYIRFGDLPFVLVPENPRIQIKPPAC